MFPNYAPRLLLIACIFFLPAFTYAQAPPPLELNKPLQRELAGGQSHTYPLTLGAQQFLNLVVEQRGIDVEVLVLGPDQKQFIKVDSPNGIRGTEPLSFVAETTGNYQLVVQSPEASAKPGAYEITVQALRPASPADMTIAAAFKSYLEMMDFVTQKKTNEAVAAQEKAVTQLEQQFGKDASTLSTMPTNIIAWYAGLVRNVGNRAQRKSDYAAAETLYQRAIFLLEMKFGKDTMDTLLPINDLAIVNYEKGDYGTAAAMMQRLLAIQQKALPPESPGIAASSTNLAAFLYKAGDYGRAEQLYRQAQAIWEKLNSKNVLGARSGIAIIQFERGDYEQAEKAWLEVLKELEADTKPSNDSQMLLAAVLGNLGGLYQQKYDNEKAESFWSRALTLRQQVFSLEHPEVAVALNRLGDVNYDKGETTKAEAYYSQGLALLKKTVGAEHVHVAYSLNGLAKTAQKKRDYPKAESLFQEALQMRRKMTGDHHPEVSETLGLLALLYQETGDNKQALSFQAQANEINETNLRRNLLAGSERQKQAYLSTFTKALNTTLGLQAWGLSDSQEAANTALTALLRSKGRSLDAMSDTVATFRRHADGEQQKLFDRLLASRSQLANLTFRGLGGEKPERYRAQLKQLEGEIDAMEADLSRRSAAFSSDAQPTTLPAIQAALPPKTSLIEFAAYQPYQFSKQNAAPTHYIAYVMNSDGTIKWKDLGEAAAIDQSIEVLRQALRDRGRSDVRQLARKVDEQVMQPLRPLLTELTDGSHLLISPDGMLNLLPFAALVDEQNRYLIERYAISYLTSGRDLLRLQVARVQKSEPLILADPDFDLNTKPNPMTLAKRGSRRRSATLHGVRAGGDDFTKWSADRLFETAKEGEAIKILLPQATLLVREKATKAALQQINAPSILHIATHGFFLEDTKTVALETRTASKSITHDEALPSVIKDPLLRSGLILAGFNQHRSEGDNGVLTAKEAAGLNLWGTKLVVLSACETGVGEVKNGEGVYGLRRALMLAGAQTQVMSLWQVDDIATREWMTGYYLGLKDGLGRGEALRQVQLKMLQKKTRQHPFYWASFIPSGEWANLDNKR